MVLSETPGTELQWKHDRGHFNDVLQDKLSGQRLVKMLNKVNNGA